MGDTLRILLLLGIAGAFVTLVGSAVAYWQDEERRIRRMLDRALQAPPQLVIIAKGSGMGAGLNVDVRKIAVLWDNGMTGLIYRLDQLVGGEMIVDDRVAARAFRGEQRLPLEEISTDARRVLLRLVFNNPRDPDFELVLWPQDASRIQDSSPFDAIQAGRRWVSSIEAILRQHQPATPSPPVTATANPGLGAAPAAAPSTPQPPAPSPVRGPAPPPEPPLPLSSSEADDPPWDEGEDDADDDVDSDRDEKFHF